MKYKTLKFSLLLILLSFSTLKADTTKKAFLDVGINSIREWSSCETGPIPEAKIEEYENECGLTWWALGDYNTPYLRQSSEKYQNYPRVPDKSLFEVLNLKN